MQWKVINGWYCVTACGLMSWKFRTLGEGMKWAFTNKVAHEVANDNRSAARVLLPGCERNHRLRSISRPRVRAGCNGR